MRPSPNNFFLLFIFFHKNLPNDKLTPKVPLTLICFFNIVNRYFSTRMHSSRMLTSGRRGGVSQHGGVCPGGDVCPGGLSARGLSARGGGTVADGNNSLVVIMSMRNLVVRHFTNKCKDLLKLFSIVLIKF